jgi:type IV secretion system protein VirD4
VLALFFQQTLGLQTTELPEHNPDLKYQLLMLLNEFTALGRIPIIAESMSYLPGYNVRVLLVIQAPSQLRDVYGPYAAETMMKSVAARIVFAPKDYPDAKEISDELGFTTVRASSHSKPAFMAFNRKAGRSGSTTFSQQPRALLLPQEVKEIGGDDALIFYEGLRPIRCKKIRYYADPRFRARLLPPPRQATPVPRRGPPAPPSVPIAVGASAPSGGEALTVETSKPETSMYVATAEDIERLDSITIEDLDERLRDLKFDHAGERPTERELDADVDIFLEALR